MDKSRFTRATEAAEYLGVSVPMAHKVIQRLNDKQKSHGYITIAGHVNRTYFEESSQRVVD